MHALDQESQRQRVASTPGTDVEPGLAGFGQRTEDLERRVAHPTRILTETASHRLVEVAGLIHFAQSLDLLTGRTYALGPGLGRVFRGGAERVGCLRGNVHGPEPSAVTRLHGADIGRGQVPDPPGYARAVKTILIVDDERNILELVRLYLEQAGYNVVEARDGQEALTQHDRVDPDLVVLDLMMPVMDGTEVTREIRRRGETPILMLTARSEDIDRIVGLELGADDYLTKPFNPREMVARVKAILRRADPALRGSRPMDVGDLRVDPRRREAYVGERRMELRPREFDLLAALARDPGVVWSRDDLLSSVWGTDFPGETRTVDVHISELRRKLGEDGPPIETVKGVGYRLVPPPRARLG